MKLKILASVRKVSPFVLVTILALTFGSGANAQSQAGDNTPVACGWVLNSELCDLAPQSARDPLHAILFKHFSAALPALEAQNEQYPMSLAIIVGLLQISISQQTPTLINSDLSTLGGTRPEDLNDTQKFELATALYYHLMRYPVKSNSYAVAKFQGLLLGLWIRSHDPVVGLMLAETVRWFGQRTDPGTPKVTVNGILDQLICSVGGPAVAWAYTRAEASNWSSPPPGIASVPDDKRFELLAVVASRGCTYHTTSEVTTYKNGEANTTVAPVVPSDSVGQEYFDAWHGELLASLGLRPLGSASG